LVKTLDLEDELLCTLRTISRIEKLRLLDLILDSSQLSTDLFTDLFSWIVDIAFAECCEENIAKDESTMWPMPIVELWISRVKVQDACRQLFRSSLKRLLERLFLRLIRMNTMYAGHWGNVPDIKQGSKRALSVVQRLMKDTLLSLLERSEDHTAFVRKYQGYLEQMDELAPGFSDVFQVSLGKTQPLKRRLDEVCHHPPHRLLTRHCPISLSLRLTMISHVQVVVDQTGPSTARLRLLRMRYPGVVA
jgi:hypothetical protein